MTIPLKPNRLWLAIMRSDRFLIKNSVKLSVVLLIAFMVISTSCSLIPGPKPEITSVTAQEKYGQDYAVIVQCGVTNNGDTGQVTVSASLNYNGFWKQSRTITIPANSASTITFEFTEPTIKNVLSSILGGSTPDLEYYCDL